MHTRNMVCFRYVIVNTMHKVNNKYNNNMFLHDTELGLSMILLA